MYEYLLLNILIILFPFLLSFDKKVHFYTKIKALIPSLAIISTVFILWDIFATHRGHWSFNSKYITGVTLAGLPVEEILFFVTVPYACIFTYEVVLHYIGDREIPFNKWLYVGAGLLLCLVSFLFFDQEYTFIVLAMTGLTVIMFSMVSPWLLRSRIFWIYIGVTLVLFVVVNYFLTSIPIVMYGASEIWGAEGNWQGRFVSIPAEDFFYNFAMLALYLYVYLIFKRRWITNDDKN